MHPYLKNRTLYDQQIAPVPATDLHLVIVIPAYDEPDVLRSLQAIKKCELPEKAVEVLVLFNDSDIDSEAVKRKNAEAWRAVQEWAEDHPNDRLRFYPLYFTNLPARDAGVGLARKIGMDEACRRLLAVGNAEGIIVGFDADSLCSTNYLVEIERHFSAHPRTSGCSIHYEHPLEGKAYGEEIYQAIALYELHLRYYINAQRFAGFPYAYQTIGSSMAVRCRAYMEQGGMNKRKAGEDFYFLNKFIHLGNYTELNDTMVIPSPRISGRVPFGTGKAVALMMDKSEVSLQTYAPEGFGYLQSLFRKVPLLFSLPEEEYVVILEGLPAPLTDYLQQVKFQQRVQEIRRNTTSAAAFAKRFYRWFNAFQIMKFLHFNRDNHHPDIPVEEAAYWLLQKLEMPLPKDGGAKELLRIFRRLDKKQSL